MSAAEWLALVTCKVLADRRLTASEKLLMVALATHCADCQQGPTRSCTVTKATLARETGYAHETIFRLVRRLVAHGVLRVGQQFEESGRTAASSFAIDPATIAPKPKLTLMRCEP